ncbi:MAG: type II toxin-antitoxin system HicB family antitoxin [Burkholderiaceae bacterium]|nr:type II toxin-antitoxin system HicB family antitoxin [Burkholderiaceae bacterium]
MEIPVVIHKDEGSVYGVTVPDIPGCHSWGETVDHAMRNVRDAIYSHVETLQELGVCRTWARRLQKYLDGPYFAVFSANSSLLALRNRQNLASPSCFFASTP